MLSYSAVETWNQTTLSQVDRFLFFLPEDKLQDIPPVRRGNSDLFRVEGAGVRVRWRRPCCAPVYACCSLFPQALMTVGRIERLFMSQRRWERGDVGRHCLDHGDRKWIFEKQQFVLQFFLGFLKINPASRERPVTPMTHSLGISSIS